MFKRILIEFRNLFTLKGFFTILYGLPVALILRIINKILLVRIMGINSERIGELIINPAIYLYQKENKINNPGQFSLDIFFMKEKPINSQIIKMLRGKLIILPKFIIQPIFEAQIKLSYIFMNREKYLPFKERQYKFHYVSDLPSSKNNICFTDDELNKGKKEIFEKFGVKDNNYVCFLVRDQKFLKTIYPKSNFDMHEYRNVEISKFSEAAKVLSEKGYHVFRMGKFQDKNFNFSDPKIIDYANSEYRSDFLDIYLSANCKFFLTTMSGLDNLLPIFNIPTIVIPLNLAIARQYKNYLISTKTFLDKNENKVSLKKLFEKNLVFRQKKEDFDSENIRPIDPPPDQIRNLVLEMHNHIINKKSYSEEENELNKEFWDIYSFYYNRDKNAKKEIFYNGNLKVLSRFDINYLKKNQKWFLN